MATPESYLRRNIKGIEINSVLDVGTGHGGIFDYHRWNESDLSYGACLDVAYIRPDIDAFWHRVLASATYLPFRDNCFDHVQSTEMIEHIESRYHEQVLREFMRVARKTIYLTASDETAHRGPAQKRAEEWNPFNKYCGIVDSSLLRRFGFRMLLDDGHKVKAFLRL